jgi:hypothetical protein
MESNQVQACLESANNHIGGSWMPLLFDDAADRFVLKGEYNPVTVFGFLVFRHPTWLSFKGRMPEVRFSPDKTRTRNMGSDDAEHPILMEWGTNWARVVCSSLEFYEVSTTRRLWGTHVDYQPVSQRT